MTFVPIPGRRLASLLGAFRGTPVWVLGDVMLDEYLVGEAKRISPEAPVQVVKIGGSERRLGGAANVARNLAALGARVALCGVVGQDAAGDEVLAACAAIGIDARAVGRAPDRGTTRKTRLVCRRQQLVRMDWEADAPIPGEVSMPLLEALSAAPRPAAIVLSDYAKGFLGSGIVSRAVALGRELRVPVIVDPKGPDLSRYRGATLLKPNAAELAVLGGPSRRDDWPALERAGRELLRAVEAEALVVTLGELGMAVIRDGVPMERVAAERREVFDVTGAGDTVMAVLALCAATGVDLSAAARIANAAAGVVVAKAGTAVAEPQEIRAVLLPRNQDKVLAQEDVGARAAAWRREGRRVVFTNGCFDLLHAGHLALLHEAARLGDVLVVALNSDASVQRLKGPGRPVVPESERLEMIAALECVDAVLTFDGDTPLPLIEAVRPDILAKGADYALDEVVGREQVEGWGGRVALVPVVQNHSTTALLRRLARTKEAQDAIRGRTTTSPGDERDPG